MALILSRCSFYLIIYDNIDDKYKIGNKRTFFGFTSTSTDPNMMKTGTVFSLSGDIWGYNIELFNYFHEKEILLEPERQFIISNVLPPLNGVIYINCNILKTNLILNDE